jgi:hypothetical protein
LTFVFFDDLILGLEDGLLDGATLAVPSGLFFVLVSYLTIQTLPLKQIIIITFLKPGKSRLVLHKVIKIVE